MIVRHRWENMLKVLTRETSKGSKKKTWRQSDQKLWISMHNLRGFIITADF